ncbi:glucosamine-6-phosphate deaminase [Lacihabitans sp. CCS-44]|uniref:glucosamine-6-phosphate deaminase n=1 Tax=Lacihabitans sp. CCS-44 TaxID=2487331 RepID=UPI0020CD1A59|nr:glucosamine-6-phosphate deaminase [Lacihabitans sp. CCS-44]MCP9756695.1 glucosamine-6-phosphate deaminase [Lacihabitans sp. CCS-44]
MLLEVFSNHEALSLAVAKHILALVRNKPNATLVLTSGNTPILAYQKLTELAKTEDFDQTFIIGLDEWVGISGESEGSCRYIVEQNLLKPLNIPESNYAFFDSMTEDLESECKRVDDLIFAKGGLDFILVGLGTNGHLGLNEPGSSFDSYCQVTNLEEVTAITGQKYFNSSTPLTKGITVGLKHLLDAKEAMVMANGAGKADIIKRMISEEINEKLPATVLRKHKDGLLWIDKEAAANL